jgi:hypothetical protein
MTGNLGKLSAIPNTTISRIGDRRYPGSRE